MTFILVFTTQIQFVAALFLTYRSLKVCQPKLIFTDSPLPVTQLHDSGSSFTCVQLLSCLRYFNLMEPEVSSPCSQRSSVGTFSDPLQFSVHSHFCFLRTHLIFSPLKLRSPKWYLPSSKPFLTFRNMLFIKGVGC
jgi:hypothetical protein